MSNRLTRFRRFWFLVLALLLVEPALRADNETPRPEKRRITVADTIQMTGWADHGYFLGGPPDGPVGLFSPDGTKFAIVVKRGNVALNTVEYSILLFQTRRVFQSPKPRVLITMSSSSNREAIKGLKWLNDGKTVVFIGENPDEIPQVYELDADTGRVRKLTNHPTPVVAYDISDDGQTTVYEAVAGKVVDPGEIRRHGVNITTQEPSDLLLCSSGQNVDTFERELFLQKKGRSAFKVPASDFLAESLPLALSPTGQYALLAVRVALIPQSWAEYKDEELHLHVTEQRRPGTWSNVARFMLLDTRTGTLTSLVNAPISRSRYGFAWAKDGSSIVLSGTYLPLDTSDLPEQEVRKTHDFVVEIIVPSKRIIKITDRSLRITKWDTKTGKILLKPVDSPKEHTTEAYYRAGSRWTSASLTDEDTRSNAPLELSLEEDINTPPRIFVRDVKSQQRILLLDLNPQFAHLQFGGVEPVSWKATDGHEVTGGLYIPPDYTAGKRYPFVIQTHGFRQDRFWIDGPWSSAFAAQPLAAEGFVVLQVGSSVDPSEDSKYADTPQEAPRQMAVYEGAIDYLDARALIDRERIGIIGFSRTVFYVEYALTHSKYRFTAASLADGFDGGYVNYLLWPTTDYVQVNGGPPVGSSLPLWLQNSPGFNLEKVTAPVRLEYYSRGYFLGGWQWFSGLSLLGKPVDFLWLPDAYHMLVKPWERLVSQQGTVDWFDFWLKGEEDPDPAKAGQYARWHELRKLQQRDKTEQKSN